MVQTFTYDQLTDLEDLPEVVQEDESKEDVYVFPLSFAQERLWFLDQFEPGSPYYNIPAAVRLVGRLDPEALERALNEIVRRHESLRTTFATVDGDPVQVILPSLKLPLPIVDMRHLPEAEREAEALRLATEEARRPFNLSQGPLLRAILLHLDAEEYLMLLTMHHIVSDGWSIGVFISELTMLYQAFSSGRPSPLDELPIQYADFALWQREWLEGEVLESQLDYWTERLSGDSAVLELPTDRPRPAIYTSRGAAQSVKLSKHLTDALKALGREERATSFMTLLAAFQTLLYRYTGQQIISVGSPIANRNRAEIEGLIGFFVNTLVLRANFSDDPTFRELLGRVREVTLGAYSHQDVPFEMLVDALQVERDMSHTPLFQVMFILQNAPVRAEELPDLTMRQLDVHSGTSTFDLTLSMAQQPDGMDASVEYNTDLFDADTIERMLEHFQILLEGIVADPDQKVSTLPLLTEAERRELLIEWNDTATDYPRDLCVHQLFEAQVERTPDADAVVVPGNGSNPRESLTYAELNQRANQLAHHLRKLGVGPETVVGVCVERSLEMIVGALGILKAGGAYLPLDPMYPEDRLAYMLEDSRVSVLLTQASLVDGLPAYDGQIIRLDADWEAVARESDANPLNHTTPENLVYMIYTSGTMGQSKGVMIQHRSLVNAYLAWEDAYQLRSVRSHLQMANFSFDVFSGDLVRALCSGGKLVVCPREWLLIPDKLYPLMRQEEVDCAEFVPAVLRHLIQYLDESEQRLDFVRVLACGSDSWYAEEYRRFLRFCGSETRLINSFGLTEATIDSSYFESASLASAAEQVVPIGRPFANMRLYVLDQQLQLVPVGVPGELCVGGLGVARGYHDRPELTADRFIPDPFSDGSAARLYRTGDMARYRPDGNIEFLGRLDHQIKIRGFRIEPGEIEAALGRHPAVREAAVMALEVAPRDPSASLSTDKRLAAYVVPTEEPGPTGGELRRFLQESLPDYMVPSAFVLMDALPLTPNGKVDREALPAPDWSQRQLEGEYVAPRTATEEMLAGIWTRVLGVERVGVRDNFFGLGGHSLLATQVVSRIREAFEIDLPLRNVFEAPTVATLAERVEIAQRTEAGVQAPPIKPISRDRELPLSFAQQRLWFLDQLEPGSPFYNIPEAVRLVGPLDADILKKSLNEVVRRHEALRTTFKTVDGKPTQVIAPEVTVPLLVTDLRDLPKAEREDEALRLAQQEAQKPFDLARGPLLRARLLRLSEEEHIILLTMHHIVGDNWSTQVLVREVAALYDAFSSGRPSPLPELPIQYADFAYWQRNWLQGEVLEAQLDYWREQLAGLPPLLELPTDRPRPPVQTYRGDYQSFYLPESLSQAIKDLCQQEGATLFMVLLAAFQTLLYRYSGQDDISVGSPIANRNRREIEDLIGFFVNTLVLRTDLSGDPSFRDLLKRVRETALGAYAHQDLPFEMIVDALQPERNLSHSPLFQVMFALQSGQMQVQSLPDSDLTIGPVEAHSGTAKFDLTLFMVEEGDRLSGAMEYNTDLFDGATIERMLRHFERLLEGIVTDPDQSVAELPLLTEAERRQLLVEWNATEAPYPQDRCAHELFEVQVERTPDAVAVTFPSTGLRRELQVSLSRTPQSSRSGEREEQRLTYTELNRRANQLAHHLQKRGVGPGTLVGICAERSPEMMVGLLGILKAGGAYLPLDPTYPPERLSFMLEDAQVSVLLTQERLKQRISESANQRVTEHATPTTICLDTDWSLIAQEPDANPASNATPEDPAYVIYTSGSTGQPKGAMIRHLGLVNYLTWCQRAYPVVEGQGAPVHSSISFDLTITGLFAPLMAGRSVKLLPEDVGVEALNAALRRESDYSLIKITPSHLELLSQQLRPEDVAGCTRAFIIGGENLLGEAIAFWQDFAPDTMLVNEYGPTETVVGCCVYQVPRGERIEGSVPIGRPIINTQLYILDEHLQPTAIGVPGELYIGGDCVGQGYLNRPKLTAERFIPDPFSERPGARLYKTGDRCRYLPDGNIEFLGRTDFQVKIRGFRIELGEIEAVLSRHPAVDEVVALAREYEPGDKRLVAYVVPEDGSAPGAGELRSFLGEKLPDYMVPSAFVTLEALPLTPNGKVDRRALPAPDLRRVEVESAYVAPRTPEEDLLVGIWTEILGVDRVGVHDSFFNLGGHSLLATQVISRIRDVFGVELPLRVLFEAPTVAGLAQSVEAARREAQGLTAPPIEPVSREGELPLSFSQQRLWFLDQLEPGTPLYNIPAAVRLQGPLDVAALERSLNEIIRRHEVLHTAFDEVDGRPVPVIVPEMELSVPVVDLRGWPEADREAEAMRRAAEEAQRPFDLAHGPLLRASLLQLDDEDYIALLTMHHIVSDDWSLGIFVQELAELYVAFSAGEPSSLPELPIQYIDFAHWQRSWLQGEVLESQLDYWVEQLSGTPPLLELPTDRPRPAVQTFRGARRTFEVPAELSEAIKALGRETGATLFMTLLAALQTLLYRYTGQDDISVGTPIANRTHSEIEDLIGFFVNTLVMRTDLSGEPSFRELLARVRDVALGAYAHQDVPFEMLVDELQLERDMSHSPLFQVMLVLQNAPRQAQELSSDLTLSPVEADDGVARFDLTLTMVEGAGGLSGALEYNTDLFDPATAERMVGHFQTLLEGIVADPDRPIAELPLLTEAERDQILVGWNATAARFQRDRCVHELFEAQVERTPDALAVVFEDQTLTYAELNARANRLAHYLRKLGVGPDTMVGISVERSLEMVVGLLGILKAGGAYLPLDPTYPPERRAFMMEDAQVPVLLTQERLKQRISESVNQRVTEHATCITICLDADWDASAIAQESQENPAGTATSDNLAYVIYTSGSTGRPKGVMLRHRGLCNLVNAQTKAFDVKADSRVLQFASFSFDASVSETFMALLTGATLYLARQETLASMSDLLELLRDRAITTVTLPPSVLKVLPAEGLPGLETLISAGEACSPEIVARWSPGRRFINAYGPTEATIGPTLCVVDHLPEGATNVPIGRPIDNTQIYLLDANKRPVPVGVPGELYVGGVGVGRGYLNRPALTAEKFIPDLFSDKPGARLYRTGDLARYRSDGKIEFLGRIDHQVKVRGFRIELGEIEAVLEQYPDLREVVVLAREDAPGVRRLVAYVVPEDELAPSISELRSFLEEKLPDYMVPSAFVTLDALPLTPSGKVDRRALPAPELDRSELESVYVAPRNPEEEILAGIWSQLLGVDRVGVHDNFFNLGGHSLLATQLMSRIRDTFEIELPLRILFEAPTVSSLAAQAQTARREAQGLLAPPIEPVSRDEELPLSFAQQRLWFLEQLEPGTPFYNLPAAVRLTGPLNVAALEQSLNEIVRRHEALRTSFDTVGGRAVQVIAPEMTVDLPVVDLTDLPASEREDEVLQLAAEEARKPFDLAEGPLLRVRLLRLADENHVVLLNMHHIVSDGWSMGVFVREIAALYEAFSVGESSPLPELPIQYADFAHWQRRWLQGEILEAQLDYWRERLSGSPPLLELPTDRPRPPVQTFRGRTYTFNLPPDLSEAVKGLSQREGATLFMTLLAAFQTLLYRYTGQEDVNVGTPIANRNRAEIEGLIGFFVNTLVMRADFSGELSFQELLQQVRETALGAYAHQDVPFEMLVDKLQIERNLSHSPLFQVVFTLQNTPMQAQTISDLALSPVEAETGIAKFDLTLSMMEGAEGLSASLEYNVDLFDAATIERMAGHFRRLLEGIVADPAQPISELPLLTEAERGQLLVEWNDTAFDYPQDKCAHELFEAHAARTPDTIAVNLEGETLTYRELNRRANQLAHYLQKRGVGPQTLVAICVERSLEMVVGLMGVLKAGGAYVPMDPTYPAERLSFMLEDTQAPVLLTQERLNQRISESANQRVTEHATRAAPSLSKGNTICLDTDWSLIAQEPEDKPESAVTPRDLAYVIYTSGSTGRPKGTLLEHSGLCNLAAVYAQDFDIGPGSRVLQFFSFSFDGSVADIFSALLSGATLCLPRRETVVSMLDLHRMMQEQGVTHVLMTPSALAVLPADDLPALQAVLSGGESCTEEVVARWSAGRRFINAYGPTEATVASSWYWVEEMPQGATSIPIGRPIANARLYVLDQYGQEVPVGVPGELHIGGVGVARGYLNRPELTADRFVPDPFSDEPGARLYRTGDQVRYLPDGTLEFLGRIDHQVKVRGFRIELGEIEAVLVQHPALREVVVLTREDTPGHKRLVAYTVSDQEPAPSVNELRDFLHEKLPDYMVPSAFVAMDALPLTSSGKVDRRALPAPEQARAGLEVAYVAPRTPEEETLADVWARLLGLERVGIHDNFFELGGDSILSIQMIAQAGQAGLHITPKQVFQHPTIEGLAALAGAAEPSQAEQGIVTGSVPLTPIQHWFFEHHPLDPHYWNTSMLLEVGQDLDVTLLEQTVEQLLTHHDALRLRFRKSESIWRQFNADVDEAVPFSYVDLSSVGVGEQREAIESTAAELQASLNLSEGPLMRVAYLDLGPGRSNRLLIIFHHLVMDGVSWRIFIEDFLRVYQQLSRGESVQLPAKTTSFRRWSQELWRYAQSSELRQELDFWLQMGAKETPALPVDYPGGANTYGSTDSITMSLSPAETRALLQEVPAAYGTQINDVLLTALVRAFARWTGERKLLIEMEGHGREHILEGVDLSRTVGWFTSTFPVLLDLDAARADGPEEELRAIQEQLQAIPSRGIGYGLLRYLCEDDRVKERLSALPTPAVNFNYLGQFGQAPIAGLAGESKGETGQGWVPGFLARSWRALRGRFTKPIRMATESVGPEQNPEATRSALLYVVGIVGGREMDVRWLYSEGLYKRATIERLAQDFLEELRRLIAHARSIQG